MYFKKNINSLRLQKSSIANLSNIENLKGMSLDLDTFIEGSFVCPTGLPKSIPNDHCRL